VGQAILPAAAFQAARRLKAGGSQDWLPHCFQQGRASKQVVARGSKGWVARGSKAQQGVGSKG